MSSILYLAPFNYKGSVVKIFDFNNANASQVRDMLSKLIAKYEDDLYLYNEETFYLIHEEWISNLQGEYKEISEEQFYEALGDVPPVRHTTEILSDLSEVRFFFSGEPYRDYLHYVYIALNGKYYTALRSRFANFKTLMKGLI